jgi:hypothetical protein
MGLRRAWISATQWVATTGFLLGLLVSGLSLIALGNARKEPFWSSIGGSLFGASLGTLIGKLSTYALTQDIKEIISQTVKDTFVSEDGKLDGYRRHWHLYHVTEMDGTWLWRHTTVDFSRSQTPGRLVSETYLLNPDGKPKRYVAEAGARDSRLIMFLRDKGNQEPAIVYVFPLAGLGTQIRHLGMVFVQTWDANNAISPAIVSLKPLGDYTKMGTIPDNLAREIDDLWRRGTAGAIPPAFT